MTRGSFLISGIISVALIASAAAESLQFQCSGDKNDAAGLNARISTSHAGDQIQIHGTCSIDKTVTLLGDRTYEGDSRTGTILRQANGANLPALLASDSWSDNSAYTGDPIRIAHLTLDGNSGANSDTDVLVIRSWLTVLEDLLVQNSPGDGIQITNLSRSGVALETTQVNGRISNCFVADSKGNGIHVVDTGNSVTDWNLLDSWVANSGKSAIASDNAAGWTIRGNHLYGVQDNGIAASRCYATSIEQNYIEDFGDAGGKGSRFGIACTVQGQAASIIGNNRIFMLQKEEPDTRYVYLGVTGVNYGTGQINVVGNSIRGYGSAADTGMDFELNGGAGLNLVSSGNNVQAVHTERVIGKGVHLVSSF